MGIGLLVSALDKYVRSSLQAYCAAGSAQPWPYPLQKNRTALQARNELDIPFDSVLSFLYGRLRLLFLLGDANGSQ